MPDETFQKNKPHSTNENTFYSNEDKSGSAQRKIYAIPISEIDTFPKHPFHVKEDEDMKALVDSIRMNGVLTPAAVRKKDNGRYELLSGHRRKRACEIAGLSTLPCKIVELNQDEAVIFMVDSNLQRTEILPSEKAFSYKMRLDAMKRQAGRPKNNSAPIAGMTEEMDEEVVLEIVRKLETEACSDEPGAMIALLGRIFRQNGMESAAAEMEALDYCISEVPDACEVCADGGLPLPIHGNALQNT